MIGLIPYLFTLAATAAIIAELIRPSLVAVWLLPAAAMGILITLIGLPEWLSVLVFFVSYCVFFLVGRAMIRLFYGRARKQDPHLSER